jgi:5-formyltetrahydrofolate cyclo-ligase
MPDYLKKHLRQTLRKIRKNLSPDFQSQSSEQVCAKIKQMEPYRQAKRIALYHAVDGEINLESLWRTAPLHGKFCYFPALTDEKKLTFLPATPATPFRNNRYNIPEPDVDLSEAIPIESIDVLFLPLVAFDRYGTRLGMGAGYYDRALTHEKPKLLVGVAYDFQYQTLIVPEPWDIALQAIVTPNQIYWSQS